MVKTTKGAGKQMDRNAKGIFVMRAAVGLGLLFAGLDKFLMWGGHVFTSKGYLQFGTTGTWIGTDPKTVVNPTHDFWVSLAGNATLVSIIDTLVVFGEVAVGAALLVGLATRFSALMGTILMALLYVSNWSFANGPFNEQFYYGIITAVIVFTGAGAYALDTAIAKLPALQRIPVVKYALG
jgi:thiosulfate dehydrogenase [quinone] large subunit